MPPPMPIDDVAAAPADIDDAAHMLDDTRCRAISL